jgi:hypothetical protein
VTQPPETVLYRAVGQPDADRTWRGRWTGDRQRAEAQARRWTTQEPGATVHLEVLLAEHVALLHLDHAAA